MDDGLGAAADHADVALAAELGDLVLNKKENVCVCVSELVCYLLNIVHNNNTATYPHTHIT